MKIAVSIGVLVILLFAAFYFVFSPKNTLPIAPTPTLTQAAVKAEEKQATFSIFTNGTKRIFTDARYHNKSEDVYLEAKDPSVIFVKKDVATWGEFFDTLPMKVTSNCLITGTGQEFCSNETHTLKFYINNILVPDALSKEIQNQDKLLISYGPKSDPAIENQLQQVPNLD